MRIKKKSGVIAALMVAVALVVPSVAFAAVNPSLTQKINPVGFTMDIVNGSGASVAAPTVAFPDKSFSFDCQTSTATLGTATQKIFVSNTGSAGARVTLDAVTSTWTDGGTNTYKVNGSGCTDGQMTVSGGSFTKTKGSAVIADPSYPGGSFTSSVSSVALFNTTQSDKWAGEFTGFTLSQQIPGEAVEANYSTPMTLTLLAGV